MKKMKPGLLIFALAFCGTAVNAQWRDTKHHLVLSGLAGARPVFGSTDQISWHQFTGRAMWYWKRPIAFGGEGSFTRVSGQYANFDAGSINGFARLKLPLGFYAEAGVGMTGYLSDGRSTYHRSSAGKFWSVGWAKSMGSRLALEVQYRRAPRLGEYSDLRFNSGFRAGLSLKL